MKRNLSLCLAAFLIIGTVAAQTSWKGTTSTNWSTSANWTSGVPNSTTDAVIGDASFTGSFQPLLTANSACKSITLGNGSVVSVLTIAKNITVSGAILIGSNGTINQNTAATVITIKGNWTNSGTYNASIATAGVTFSGAAQTITGATTFRLMTVNSGSTVTLANNITVNNGLSITGTLDPTASYAVSGTGTLTVNSGGVIHVKATDYGTNYPLSGAISMNGRGTVNYSSSAINQTVSNAITYGYLRISGGLIKTLAGNLPGLNSSAGNTGRIYIDAGTLDLLTFTANRASSGGNFTMAAGTTLKIGGTNGFPSNYNTLSFAATSTVDYYGDNQTVLAASYGNLAFKSTSGSVVKTMPGSAITVAGSFSCTVGSGTAVTFTAGNKITVTKDVFMDASATFNAGSFSHTFKGSWTNSGIFSGSTSTATFSGANGILSGSGTNNFNNLVFSGAGITASGSTSINVSGNLSVSGSGTFTHSSSGTLTMTGASKTITGTGLSFFNLSVTGTVTSTPNLTVAGDLTVDGTYTATNGILTLSGTSKTIAGSGSITFSSLKAQGTISTANTFTMTANLTVALSGSFTASSGTMTVNGTNNLSGTANLYNVTINSGKTLRMGSNAILGIANVFTKTGTLNVTTNTPNTIEYNSSGAQSVVNTTYNNLKLANGGTKTAAGAITVNNDFTINSGVTFSASTFTFSLYRHFTNNGTFSAGTSTVSLLGANVANITGATTFNNLTENKSSAVISVNVLNNITTSNLTMTAGNMQTGTKTVTITGTRSGNGILIGVITHSHAFTNGTAYYFEGPQNSITFTTPSAGLTAVTVTVTIGSIADFNGGESVQREYNIAIPAGTYTNATFRMHYEDNELNAFYEPSLTSYHYNSGTSTWDSIGYTTRSSASNYVERTGITAVTGRWALSGVRNVVRWNGSVSGAWENAANWTTISGSDMSNRVPNSTDDAQIGQGAFTNNPTLTSSQTVNILRFGSVQTATCTIGSGGALTVVGAAKGEWSANASHVLNVSTGTLTLGTNMDLSDGTSNHSINLKIGSGTVTINNNLNQSGNSSITFTGNGTLSLGANYNYTSGTFTCGTGNVIYTGTEAQVVAPLTYYNLSFTKSTERATINDPVVVSGDLTTSTGGELEVSDTLSVTGNITIGAGNTMLETGVRINAGGNFTNNGTFTVDDGTFNFNSSGAQSVNANTFNTVIINKSAGTLTLTGDLVINSDLTLTSGTLDLVTYLADRSNPGGTLTLGAATSLKISGVVNYPNYYSTSSISSTSTVEYYGTVAQSIADVDYGNLTLSNGGATAKALLGSVVINGDFLINSGSTFDPDSNNITLYGNMTDNGTYTPAASTVILKGTSKTISGTSTLSLYSLYSLGATYTITSSAITLAGDIFVDVPPSSISFGTGIITLDGDLTNKGSLTSSGTLNISGTRVQTLSLIGAIVSASTGIVNFNGTVLPITFSTSPPSFYTVNINNTGGTLAPSQPWTVVKAITIAAGVTVDFGANTHTFYGNFTNNGTVLSSGKLKFTPILAGPPFPSSATVTLDAAGGSFTSTGEIEFAGSAPITVSAIAPTLTNLTVTNVNATGVTLPVSCTIAQDIFIGPGATLNAGAALSHTFSGNLTDNGTLTGNTSTITFNGNPVAINGIGSTTFNNLTIATGADLSLNKSINVSGNLVDNASFTTAGRSVSFTGTGASTLSGTAASLTFDDLEQNKTGAATTFSFPVIVTGDLTMTNGIINTTSTNLLTLNDNATSTAGTSTSYVSGPIKKIGDDAFIFPVGKGAYWARVGISAPASITAAFQAEYFASAYSNISSVSAPLDHVSHGEHWILNRTSGTENVTATLFWEDGTRSGINDLTDLSVARFDGTNWTDETQAGGTTGTVAAGSVTSQVVTSFSPFAFGGKIPGGAVNPLPIHLLDFYALPNENKVNVIWSTASETNSDHFEIERSIDAVNFRIVGTVPAAGNSSQKREYANIDASPVSGISYYRLKEIDLNGNFVYSNTVPVNMEEENSFLIFPNPAVDNFNISIKGKKQQEVLVVVLDIFGKEHYSKVHELSGGEDVFFISLEERLSPGIYSVIASSSNFTEKKKLIIR